MLSLAGLGREIQADTGIRGARIVCRQRTNISKLPGPKRHCEDEETSWQRLAYGAGTGVVEGKGQVSRRPLLDIVGIFQFRENKARLTE